MIFITHDCPAIEFVDNGQNAMVLDFDDPKQVAVILGELSNKDYLRTLGENAHKWVQQEFSEKKVSEDLRIILEKCVKYRSKNSLTFYRHTENNLQK